MASLKQISKYTAGIENGLQVIGICKNLFEFVFSANPFFEIVKYCNFTINCN